MNEVTTNIEQRLFVIPSSGGGYSCLGFEVCFNRAAKLADALGRLRPIESENGTLPQYNYYLELIQEFSARPDLNQGMWIEDPTDPKVVEIIRQYHSSRKRLRIFYGDSKTGRDWMSEYNVIGTVGRSTGTMKIPLLIASTRSYGGGAISTSSIVRLMDVKNKSELWSHPFYHQPAIETCESGHASVPFGIKVHGKEHANFKTDTQRSRWIEFMCGNWMSK